MTKMTRIICALLLIAAACLMFAPIATFEDNSAAALQEEIDKQTGRLESEQAKLQRYIDQGKAQKDLDKQQAKIEKQQGKVDELLAEQAALAEQAGESGLKYALLPGQLPEAIEINMQVVNENGAIYPTDFSNLYLAAKLGCALLVLAAVCILMTKGAPASKFYTYSSFCNLAGVLIAAYCILRVRAIPVKLPYGNPQINWVLAGAMLILPAIALLINCSCILNSKRSMIYVLCIALCAMSLLPFWIMMVNATRNSQQIQGGASLIPSTFLKYNWTVLSSKNFNILTGFKNSAIIAFCSTLLSVYFSALTAYGLTVYKFKGAKFLYSVVLAIIMIPGQVTATGFYMFMYRLGWTNSYLPLVVPSIAAASTVFFFKQYLEANFQISLVEAARIDGAGEFYTYNTIILPIMIPAMATMGIMAVIGSWNNYLTPLMLLSDPSMKTLPMMVKELRGDIYRTEFGSIYLGLTLTALPLLIVYFCFSKYIIAGVAVGGVKE